MEGESPTDSKPADEPRTKGLCIFYFRELLGVTRHERCLPATVWYHRCAFSFALLLIRADQNDFRANQKERE